MMTGIDQFGKSYLELILEINKHQNGFIDAYFSPLDIKERIEKEEKKAIPELQEKLELLKEKIAVEESTRKEYLSGIFRSIDCTLRKLNGEEFELLDEVSRLYGITPKLKDDFYLDSAINELDSVLPGSGEIVNRLDMWRGNYLVPDDKLEELLKIIHDEARKRTKKIIDLDENEQVDVELVTDKPWAGYNLYLGDAKSKILINADFPRTVVDIIDLVAHESYPGHHTELQVKEKMLYRDKNLIEFGSVIVSPYLTMHEGMAMTAIDIIFQNQSYYDWAVEDIFPLAGLPKTSAEELKRVGEVCKNSLFYTIGISFYAAENAAYKYLTGELNEDQTIDYLQSYGLTSKEMAENFIQFFKIFKGYIFTYIYGHSLIEQVANGQDKKPVFMYLLKNGVLPSQLQEMDYSFFKM